MTYLMNNWPLCGGAYGINKETILKRGGAVGVSWSD